MKGFRAGTWRNPRTRRNFCSESRSAELTQRSIIAPVRQRRTWRVHFATPPLRFRDRLRGAASSHPASRGRRVWRRPPPPRRPREPGAVDDARHRSLISTRASSPVAIKGQDRLTSPPHLPGSRVRSRCARSRRRSPCPPAGRRASSSSATRAPRSAVRAPTFPRSRGTL